MIRAIGLLFGCISISSFADTGQDMHEFLSGYYDEISPGASVIVVRDGETLLSQGYGLANLEHNVANSPETVFRLASVSKQFTAIGILLLVEDGKLRLDDKVTKYVPEMKHAGEVTIEHLLSHTSGIPSYTNLPGWMAESEEALTTTQMLAHFQDLELEFEPGTAYDYNNSGFFLLGMIIEKISGESFEDFVRQQIFEPLDMKDSYYGSASRVIAGRADGYDFNQQYVNAPYLSVTQPYAAGSLLSTTEDMAKWAEAIHNAGFVSAELLTMAFRKYQLKGGDEVNYGYGFQVSTVRGHTSLGHGGAINGFRTHSLYIPKFKTHVAVLSNRTNGPETAGIARQLGAMAIGDPYSSFTALPLDKDQVGRMVGVYEIEGRGKRFITFEDGKLYSQREGNRRLEIHPAEGGVYFYPQSLTYFTLDVSEEGHVKGMLMRHDGEDEEYATLTDEPLPEERRVVAVDESILGLYVGDYQLMPGFIMSITLEDGALYSQGTGQPKIRLFAESEAIFFPKEVAATVEFRAKGDSFEMWLKQGENELICQKQ